MGKLMLLIASTLSRDCRLMIPIIDLLLMFLTHEQFKVTQIAQFVWKFSKIYYKIIFNRNLRYKTIEIQPTLFPRFQTLIPCVINGCCLLSK